jgi:hypothetical protein
MQDNPRDYYLEYVVAELALGWGPAVQRVTLQGRAFIGKSAVNKGHDVAAARYISVDECRAGVQDRYNFLPTTLEEQSRAEDRISVHF